LKVWNQSSDRELTPSGQRSRAFYDCVDRLLQNEVQLARLERTGANEGAQQELRQQVHILRKSLY